MPRLAAILASLAVILAVVPAAASAASTSAASTSRPAARANFALAHPSAGRLCQRVAAGHIPPGLEASADKLAGACADLKAAYAAATTSLGTATSPLRDQLAAARRQARTDCATARRAGDRASCRAALRTFKLTSRALAAQGRAAVAQYRAAMRAADSAFFGAVRSLSS